MSGDGRNAQDTQLVQTEGQVQGAEVERKSELSILVGGGGSGIREVSTTKKDWT